MAKPASRTVTKTKHRTAALRPGSVSPRETGQRPNHQAIADWQGRTTDELCEAIMRGAFLTTIADEWGMSLQSLLSWIASDPDRSTRAREARDYSGYAYDQQAEGVLKALQADATPAQITQARELASHYRWRASKMSSHYKDGGLLGENAAISLTVLIEASMQPKPIAPPTIDQEP